MRHFVQYHNPRKMGSYRHSRGDSYGIETDKPVDSLVGDRIWLVTRDGDPLCYSPCETFIVETVERVGTASRRNKARASKGKAFTRPMRLDSEPWFPALQRSTGNFAFGLQRIQHQRIIAGLSTFLCEV